MARAALPAAGGTLLIDPVTLALLLPITTNPGGSGSLPIALPLDPGLIGIRIDFQALFDTPFSLTNGLEAVVCP